MIRRAAEEIATFFVKKGVIEEKERDVYTYGSELLVSETISMLLVLSIGLYVGKILETVIYLFTYIVIRVYAGGYHASSHRKCITIFSICYGGVLCTIEMLYHFKSLDILCIVTFVAIIIIFLLAPVEDIRKPLSREEVYIYRKETRKRVLLLGIFAIILIRIFPQLKDEISYGLLAICEISLLLLVGYIKNKRLFYQKRMMMY